MKTGSDANRWQVRYSTTNTYLGYLTGLTPPSSSELDSSYAHDHRIKWPELKTWEVYDVLLYAVKLEDDGDIHMRLETNRSRDMIGEIPEPSCVSSSSRWRGKIADARYAITSRYRVSQDYWTYVNRRVNARGLGFFDIEHGVTGAAPNDIELHPVTHVQFR